MEAMHAGVLDATSLALPSSEAFLADGPASFFDAGLVPQANGHSPFARVECSPDFLPNHRNVSCKHRAPVYLLYFDALTCMPCLFVRTPRISRLQVRHTAAFAVFS